MNFKRDCKVETDLVFISDISVFICSLSSTVTLKY